VSSQTSRVTEEDDIERINQNVNGLFAQVGQLKERVAELEDELEEERAKREAAEDRARRALAIARQIDDGTRSDGGPPKKSRAERLSRNEVVRQALEGSGRGGSVTAGKVQDMGKPEVQLYHRTVRDAWDSLETTWDELRVQERDDKDDRLVVDAGDVSEELVAVVEEDLSRDDLSERLHRGES
jgi:outer membrane murein-binding lipoprotein Lpp